jgi:hypothetical protein
MKTGRWLWCVGVAIACEPAPKGDAQASPVRGAPSASSQGAVPRAKYGRDWLEPPAAPSAISESTAPSPSSSPARPAPRPGAPGLLGGADELRAVSRARALLLSDPKGALAVLTELARTQPRGYFMEEREALVILALVQSGNRVLARRKAAVFVIAHPRGTLTDQVRAATGL